MARKQRPKIKEEDLHGFKHFKLLVPLLERLHDHACRRDRAGNRKLHYDQYASLILLYFFNPIVTSLRGIQQASELKKVQRILGCSRASFGSLSEAARVFDADLLRGMIGELLGTLSPIQKNTPFDEIKGIITLVDGSLLPALPKIVEAMWRKDGHKAFKLHTHFELLKGVPATRVGLDCPMRIVEVRCKPHRKRSGKTGRGGPEQGETLLIATDLLDVSPEVVALIYKHRWAIEMHQSYCLLCHRFYDTSDLGFGLVNSAA